MSGRLQEELEASREQKAAPKLHQVRNGRKNQNKRL